MQKTILYVGLTLVGVLLTLFSPIWGAALNVSTYLMNPQMLATEFWGFRFQMWAASALIITIILHQPKRVPAVGGERWILRFVWIYLAIAFLSSSWAEYDSEIAWEEAYEFFKTILVASLFLFVIRSEKDMTFVVWVCLIGVVHAAFMHVIGPKIGYVPPSFGDPRNERGASIEYQGMLLSLFLPIFILKGLYAQRWYGRLFCWVSIPLVLDSMVNTYMRTVFAALIAQTVLLFFLLPKRLVLRLLPIFLFALVLFLYFLTPPDYWNWVGTIRHPQDEGSANSRFIIIEASQRMFDDFPMGVGYKNFMFVSPRYLHPDHLTYTWDGKAVRSPHSSYFAVLCETGVAGFTFWILAILCTLWVLRGIRKRQKVEQIDSVYTSALGIEIGLYGWLVGGLVSTLSEVDPAYWFMAFAVILRRLQHQKLQQAVRSAEDHADERLEITADQSTDSKSISDMVPVTQNSI